MRIVSGVVVLYPNPDQQFNTVDNYATRLLYFFLQKGTDGSITLQIQSPPFYTNDAAVIDSGVALIDSTTVIQTYTAAEVAALSTVDITCTVTATPNTNSTNGYSLYANLFQWLINLDPKSNLFYRLQSSNITTPFSLNALYDVSYNSNNGEFSIYSNLLGYNKWLSTADGVFLSESLIDNAYFSTTAANTSFSKSFTFRVDLSRISLASVGTYSFYLSFVMTPIEITRTFLELLDYYSLVQQTQINYLYNSILDLDAFLNGDNALYDPVVSEQVILNANRTFLIHQYTITLAAMSAQWDGYAALPNLSSDEQSVVTTMLTFIATANTNLETL